MLYETKPIALSLRFCIVESSDLQLTHPNTNHTKEKKNEKNTVKEECLNTAPAKVWQHNEAENRGDEILIPT